MSRLRLATLSVCPCSSLVISPTSDGAGAAVLASEAFVRKHHLENQAVEIVAQEMVTDFASTFEENSCIKMVRNSRLKVRLIRRTTVN